MWKWILRPVVIALTGTSGAKAAEGNPFVGLIILGISLLMLIAMIADIMAYFK